MHYVTGTYQSEGRSTALFCRQTAVRDRTPAVLAFLIVGAKEDPARIQKLRDRIAGWWEDQRQTICPGRRQERVTDRLFAHTQTLFAAQQAAGLLTEQDACALFCALGTHCFYMWKGQAELWLMQTCFDRATGCSLTTVSAGMQWRRADWEAGAGILLGNASFFRQMDARRLGECLQASALTDTDRVSRHLAETATAAVRGGAPDPVLLYLGLQADQVPEETLLQLGYRVLRPLGSGAQGKVYLVAGTAGVLYACKVAAETQERILLRQEATLQREIRHPLFAAYHDLRDTAQHTFFFMEYIQGVSLREMLRGKTKDSGFDARAVMLALAEGLADLQERPDPILYRDLKPEHVLFDQVHRRVRLLDLGCARPRSVAGRSRAGTRGYAAPEQLDDLGIRQDTYSDVYAFGKLLRVMLPGTAKRKRSGADALPAVWQQLATRCTAEQPQERPQCMRDVLTALKAQPMPAPPACIGQPPA
ncbi:MAG: protein kinase [Lachnospiraceae bacterium]|nr:protein kinase [Lachnospiraceae bacterium]